MSVSADPFMLSSDRAIYQPCLLGKSCVLARVSLGKGRGLQEHKEGGEEATQGKGRCVV